jgi:hypothetical protein
MQKKLKIIVCPNEEKLRILDELSNEDLLYNIKFMTKKEFIDNYYFTYNDEALFYLVKKYDLNLDVAKVYLNNLYVIDINKEYVNDKLKFLSSIKKELIENNLLIFNPSFKKYISNSLIEVRNYYDLDKYEEEALGYVVDVKESTINTPVIEFATMEEEVNYTCIKIRELLDKGIDINKIFLCNISQDYLYTIDKLFSYYNIPINIDFRESIYSTKVVYDYLETGEVSLDNKDNNLINRKLINILGDISCLDMDSPITRKILIDKLKNTYLSSKKKSQAVNIKDLYKESFKDDEYVFVLGFNQDSLPKMEKDIKYINDSLKDEVALYKTSYLNKRNKEVVTYLLSRIKNLVLTYKLASPFSSFYKSSLINDLGLEVIREDIDKYNYSNKYNMIRLGEKLDKFNLFGEKEKYLEELNTHYKIPYKTYSNNYTGISNDLYLKNLDYPLKLSYTALNSYNECRFKYYIKNVLKLDDYTSTFSAFIGSMYHKILSLYRRSNFNLEEEYNKYLELRDLSLKEKILLVRIKKDLCVLIEELKKQQLLTGYDDELYEAKAEVSLDKKVAVVFVGYIDKIMYYKKVEDTYFSIIDYKSGNIDTHIEPMKYGLHMQLPVYLYLIHYSKVFSNPIFTGIYYQNILFNYPSWSLKLDSEIKNRYLLQGYSTDDTAILSRFDSTYEESQYIKSMKYSDEKGFGTYSKVISNDTLYELVKFTKKHIDLKCDEIIEGDFRIDPKVYAGNNVSCEFCTFKDLCFMKEKDLVYLEKQSDLSFLGGEE